MAAFENTGPELLHGDCHLIPRAVFSLVAMVLTLSSHSCLPSLLCLSVTVCTPGGQAAVTGAFLSCAPPHSVPAISRLHSCQRVTHFFMLLGQGQITNFPNVCSPNVSFVHSKTGKVPKWLALSSSPAPVSHKSGFLLGSPFPPL